MRKSRRNRSARRPTNSFLPAALVVLGVAANLAGQSFPSGSTGADGALNITTPNVTTLPAPVGGGNIYNFTTINVAAGSTLKLSAAAFPGPVYFLATGAVTIAGTIDLSGQSGSVPTTSAQRTTGPIVPGAGGYGGGLAGFGAQSPLPGLGPLGGAVSVSDGCNGAGPAGGGFSGNQFLVPLVGGSGGGANAGSGGAGGGALLMASSVSITVTGTITAQGGSGALFAYGSGGGAGGGVRLVAPVITGNGTITTAGGPGGFIACSLNNSGASGIVRLESYQYSFTGTIHGTFYTATPVSLFLPGANAQPLIMVTSIGGVSVPSNPTGTFTVPDVVLNTSTPVTVNIKASNIPLGTIPTVYFITENFPNQAIAASSPGLGGTLASSTATATVTLNPGYTVGYVVANWTQ